MRRNTPIARQLLDRPQPLRFEGTLKGNVLQGSIVFPTFAWPTSGQASEDHVTMTAMNVFWDLRR